MYVATKKLLSLLGLEAFLTIALLIKGDNRAHQLRLLKRTVLYPMFALLSFLLIWSLVASKIETSLGRIPGPARVYNAAVDLWRDHALDRANRKEFYALQDRRISDSLLRNPHAELSREVYIGKPTYIDQVATSLNTVFTGFLLASLIAIPLGLICGLSKGVMSALNPLIQVLKPISPLAWLPLVTLIVTAVYVRNDGFFEKSFIISAITVALCSMWPTLINTAHGVERIETDYLNLAKIYQLTTKDKITKIVIPASLPLIFTGLRISLGIGWMVLIATEMLAQNPGLGKFVWDEFQNGSSNSLAKIMVAVITIGVIGFLLDRVMLVIQNTVSGYSNKRD